MSATPHATTPTPAFIQTPRGTSCPVKVTQDWLNVDPEVHAIIAGIALYQNAEPIDDDGWTYTVVTQTVDAIRDGGAIVVQYRNDDGEVSARVLFPTSATVTKKRHLTCYAYCTFRREYRTFRLDRVLDCHAMTLPFEQVA